MAADARVVLIDERPDGLRLAPSDPLGSWVMRHVDRILRALDPGSVITLDLERAPVTEPRHVAAVLWLVDRAAQHDIGVTVEASDMISAELLAFSGVEAAVQMGGTQAPASQAL